MTRELIGYRAQVQHVEGGPWLQLSGDALSRNGWMQPVSFKECCRRVVARNVDDYATRIVRVYRKPNARRAWLEEVAAEAKRYSRFSPSNSDLRSLIAREPKP